MIEVGPRPVLILWGTIVAEHLGFDRDEALTLGRALASLGGRTTDPVPEIMTPAEIAEIRATLRPGQTIDVALFDRVLCMTKEPDGLRAVVKNRLIDPVAVERYLGEQFGDHIDSVAGAMISLAETLPPPQLMEWALELYERFRPEANELDIDRIAASIRSTRGEDALSTAQWMSPSSWEDAQGEMPSFRGPQALTGRAIASHGVEPLRRERTAYHAQPRHAPGQIADARGTKSRKWIIEQSAPSRPMPTRPAVAPATRPKVRRAIAAPMWPLTLAFAIFLASAIGGGVGALLVSPPQQASVLGELRSLASSSLYTSLPPPRISEPEPFATYFDPNASSRHGEATANEMPTPPSEPVNGRPEYPPADDQGVLEVARIEPGDDAPRTAPLAVEMSTTPSNPVNGAREYPPVENPAASDAARMEPGDEAPSAVPIAVETSISPSNPVSTTPEVPPVDNHDASDVARAEPGDEAPRAAPTAVEMSTPPSNPVSRTPEDLPVNNHGASETARIAMERGDERMRRGDVASARRFYEMAAATGMIEAATAIGRTFDPLYLRRIGVRGALADAHRAKQWYEKAARAGDIEAQARIELMTFDRLNH
jgi:hypothetical protein